MAIYGNKSEKVQEQSEEKSVTETDIKTADMYMEEAQVYIKHEVYLAAIEVLMEGVEETGDAALAEKENDLREHVVVRKKKVYEYAYVD